MRTVNLEQGSQEWLDYRTTKVGASEVSNLFNANPFCSAEDQTKFLLGLKLGFNSIFTNAAMKAGNDNEAHVVKAVEDAYDIITQPLVGHKGNISASFDGITLDGDIVVEVKYSDYTYNYVKEKGFTPPHYEMQVQQQLLVSGAEKAIFAVMHTETKEVVFDEIYPKAHLHSKIEEKVESFFELMHSKEWKEEDFNEEREDQEWLEAVANYKDAKAMEDEAKKAISRAKKVLIELSNGVRSKGGGISVYPVKGRETINWKGIVEDAHLTVDDRFKKQGASSWAVRIA